MIHLTWKNKNSKVLLLVALILAISTDWHVQSFVVNAERSRSVKALSLPRTRKLYESTVSFLYDGFEHNSCDEANASSSKSSRSAHTADMAEYVSKEPNAFSRFYSWYNDCLINKPIITKGVTAGIVNVLGDILGQYIEFSGLATGSAFVPDIVRLQVFFLCGVAYVGPVVHWWNEVLWKFGIWFNETFNSQKQVQTLAQLLLDQTVGVILLTISYFYAYEVIDALVYHRVPDLSAATIKLTGNLRSVMLTNYSIWPVVNWLSFTYVPLQFRVLLNNVVGVFWNAFLCAKIAGG